MKIPGLDLIFLEIETAPGSQEYFLGDKQLLEMLLRFPGPTYWFPELVNRHESLSVSCLWLFCQQSPPSRDTAPLRRILLFLWSPPLGIMKTELLSTTTVSSSDIFGISEAVNSYWLWCIGVQHLRDETVALYFGV